MKIVIKVKPKHRAHRALFDDDLPFKSRKEESKKAYKRREKHRNNREGDME